MRLGYRPDEILTWFLCIVFDIPEEATDGQKLESNLKNLNARGWSWHRF